MAGEGKMATTVGGLETFTRWRCWPGRTVAGGDKTDGVFGGINATTKWRSMDEMQPSGLVGGYCETTRLVFPESELETEIAMETFG